MRIKFKKTLYPSCNIYSMIITNNNHNILYTINIVKMINYCNMKV